MGRWPHQMEYAGLVLVGYRIYNNLRHLGLGFRVICKRKKRMEMAIYKVQFVGVAVGMLRRAVFPFSRRNVISFVCPVRSGTFRFQSE
jgi:hypothetical protein